MEYIRSKYDIILMTSMKECVFLDVVVFLRNTVGLQLFEDSVGGNFNNRLLVYENQG